MCVSQLVYEIELAITVETRSCLLRFLMTFCNSQLFALIQDMHLKASCETLSFGLQINQYSFRHGED